MPSIKLTRSAEIPGIVNGISGYRFTVTASEAVDMPNEIFRMYRRPLDPIEQTTTDQFEGICTPADLQNLPINEPRINEVRFRLSEIDVFYETSEKGDLVWTDIKAATRSLVNNLAASEILTNVEVITISS